VTDPPARSVDLRPATAADAARVAAIWEQGWRDAHLGNVPDALVAVRTPESFGTRATERVADTTVATVGDEVAGFVMVVGDEVEQVYVSVDHHGSGIAVVLLAEAERLVALSGHARAWLAVVPGNTRARRFYQRCGWTDDGLFDYPAAHDDTTIHVPCHRYIKSV
jgi:GNAT superfamily N-acetyltransferase